MTWYRVVAIANAQTEWARRWVLQQQGDGPYVRQSMTAILIFPSVAAAVTWVKEHGEAGTHVELPH